MMLHQNIVPLSTRFFFLKMARIESTTTPGNYRTIAWEVKKQKQNKANKNMNL